MPEVKISGNPQFERELLEKLTAEWTKKLNDAWLKNGMKRPSPSTIQGTYTHSHPPKPFYRW